MTAVVIQASLKREPFLELILEEGVRVSETLNRSVRKLASSKKGASSSSSKVPYMLGILTFAVLMFGFPEAAHAQAVTDLTAIINTLATYVQTFANALIHYIAPVVAIIGIIVCLVKAQQGAVGGWYLLITAVFGVLAVIPVIQTVINGFAATTL